MFRSQEDMYSFITSMILEDEEFKWVFELCNFDILNNLMALEIRHPQDKGVLGRFYATAAMYVGGEGAITSFGFKFAGGSPHFKGTEAVHDHIIFGLDGHITTRKFEVVQSYEQVTNYLPKGIECPKE